MSRFKLFIVAVSFSLGLAMAGGSALAQETTENVTATDGDAAARGPGNASAAPGLSPAHETAHPDSPYSGQTAPTA